MTTTIRRVAWLPAQRTRSEARDKANRKLPADGNADLAANVRQFQFRDIRPKAASEINDLSDASVLLGHSKEESPNAFTGASAIAKPSEMRRFRTGNQ
nr:hypothetical protein [Pseudomonas sp. Marseille-Q3773]